MAKRRSEFKEPMSQKEAAYRRNINATNAGIGAVFTGALGAALATTPSRTKAGKAAKYLLLVPGAALAGRKAYKAHQYEKKAKGLSITRKDAEKMYASKVKQAGKGKSEHPWRARIQGY